MFDDLDEREYPDPEDWTDDDAPLDEFEDPDLADYRPPSRAGTAALALGAVAGFLLAALGKHVVGARQDVLGMLVAAVIGLMSVAGFLLAVGSLRQPGVKRTFAAIGLVVNLGILIIIFVLATPDRAM